MKPETLNVLADAISEKGIWQWWTSNEEMFQLDFSDVLLYSERVSLRQSHACTLALQFYGNPFAVFLDNIKTEAYRNWYERLYLDEIPFFSVETFAFQLNDRNDAEEVFNSYRNKTGLCEYEDFRTVESAKHILAAKCGKVGFIAGGDEIRVLGKKGYYTDEEIIRANNKWWAYWRDYWLKRKTKDAYQRDTVCEAIIPADRKNPVGNWDGKTTVQ
jgi:hypothetical protein